MSHILVCGDSFCVTDPDFPMLHWSEKLLNFSPNIQLSNLSHGGCSNAMIAMQLVQGLHLKPDFVVLSFTGESRYEIDKELDVSPLSLTANDLADYHKKRYITNMYFKDKEFDFFVTTKLSNNFEKIKNYFYIIFCLHTLKTKNISFAFSLGGFEYKQDYTAFLNCNYLYNFINDYTEHELKTNLWYYQQSNARPFFHVANDNIQTLFANECWSRITNLQEKNC